MKYDYEEKKNRRIEYANMQADKNHSLSDHYYVRSKNMLSCIPMGQPILIGHYSEKGDRNFRNKAWNLQGKSVAATAKAKYYEEKAYTIANNTAISSDNPNALELLKEKLAACEAKQKFMKAANICFRKKDKDAFMKLEGATLSEWNENITPSFGRPGYQTFELSNNNAEISRLKKRITQLEKIAQIPFSETEVKGIIYRLNPDANRVQLVFPDKPAKEIREALGKAGFYFSYAERAWGRLLNNAGIWAAKEFLKSYNPDTNN